MTKLKSPAALRVSSAVRHTVSSLRVRNDALVWVRSGSKHFFDGENEITVPSETIVLLSRDSHWSLVNDPAGKKSYEADVLEFGDSALTTFYLTYGSDFPRSRTEPGVSIEVDYKLVKSLSKCFETLRSTTSSLQLKIHEAVEVLILLAERGYTFSPRSVLTFPDRVRQVVAQAPHEDWKYGQIARLFHMSESTLRRRLLKYGVTKHEVVFEVRIRTALTLLQTTDLPIGQISLRCGYKSHSRFSATFRQHYGCPPSQLRSSRLNDGETKNEQHLTVFAQQALNESMMIGFTLPKEKSSELHNVAA